MTIAPERPATLPDFQPPSPPAVEYPQCPPFCNGECREYGDPDGEAYHTSDFTVSMATYDAGHGCQHLTELSVSVTRYDTPSGNGKPVVHVLISGEVRDDDHHPLTIAELTFDADQAHRFVELVQRAAAAADPRCSADAVTAGNDRTPRYRLIADDMQRRIKAGAFAPGFPLPGEPALATEYAAARGTVRQALGLLRSWGLVATVPYRGHIVQAVTQ
jgi:hypothetical protein